MVELYEAREAATSILFQNLDFNENSELSVGIDQTSPDFNQAQITSNIFIEFSQWPDPFNPILDEGSEYVRVRVESVSLNNFLAQIVNFNKQVRASAVAGKSTDIACMNKVVPMMVCAVNDDSTDNFGLVPESLYVMKVGANQGSSIGPGNFQLLRLYDGSGASDIRRALAGEFNHGECVGPGDDVVTEPGGSVGPVVQGLNTRFGQYSGGGVSLDEFPRDFNSCEGDRVEVDSDGNIIPFSNPSKSEYTYDEYINGEDGASSHCNIGDVTTDDLIAATGRRELPVVIGLCDGLTNGSNTITALGTGCFFLSQTVSQQGNIAHVIGEFVTSCVNTGTASLDPSFVSNSSTIVLYRDPDSPDS